MKKILGVSLIAVLAATPMMANAMTKVSIAATNVEQNEIGDANKMATVSYVKGAYNAVADEVNTKQDALSAGNSAVSTTVIQSSGIKAASSAAEASDSSLVTEKAVLTAIKSATDGAVTSATLENTYATKEGVTKTISASTIAATVPALADWNSSAVTSVAIDANITGAAYTAE